MSVYTYGNDSWSSSVSVPYRVRTTPLGESCDFM